MKFKYKKLAKGVIRPVIPVELKVGTESVRFEALVDSGADMCIFPAELADILGIDLKSGTKGLVAGITGTPAPYWIHPITLEVGGWPKVARVAFQPNMPLLGYGVVGQIGFFDRFVVKFDYKKEEIELFQRS